MTTLDARMGAAQFGTHFDEALARALPAIFTLGAYYELGLGVEKNLERARLHHEEAARLGFPQSMVEAGIFYEQVCDDSFRGSCIFSLDSLCEHFLCCYCFPLRLCPNEHCAIR